MNMFMNNNEYELPKKEVKKRVKFEFGTKEHDGQLEKNTLFCKIILEYFNKSTIKNATDIYKIIEKQPSFILNLISESIIILIKLNEIKREEDMILLIKKIFPKPAVKHYSPKDIDDYYLMKIWDTPLYNLSANKKCNVPKGVGISRNGSKIYSEKLMTQHIPYLIKFIKILLETYKLITNKNF